MKKETAIKLLGGSVSLAAQKIGITYQAVMKWPDDLTPAIADRVIAAIALENPSQWPRVARQLITDKTNQSTPKESSHA
ncbi:hypothetical protein [Paenalcaligenes suwonensis]|uniref:hypothetical protein n=1 Tax=Paenalcaligenes suwonensis TaxID=1202713 RepID=UPI001A984692|nr:hypothetical protein [Paenalcaligenes suwonensis]